MPEVRKGLLPMGLLPSGAAPGSGFGFRASFEPRISAFSADERGSGSPMPPAAPSAAAKLAHDLAGLLKLCFLAGFVFNILVAVWIYRDIRKRGDGSGIFIALALLAGIPAAIIYSLVRIAEKKP